MYCTLFPACGYILVSKWIGWGELKAFFFVAALEITSHPLVLLSHYGKSLAGAVVFCLWTELANFVLFFHGPLGRISILFRCGVSFYLSYCWCLFLFNLAENFSCHLKIIFSTDQHVSENIRLSHIIMFNTCFVKNVACNMEATEIRDVKFMPQGTDMLKQHFHLNEYF